jgi:hypothetical protein
MPHPAQPLFDLSPLACALDHGATLLRRCVRRTSCILLAAKEDARIGSTEWLRLLLSGATLEGITRVWNALY